MKRKEIKAMFAISILAVTLVSGCGSKEEILETSSFVEADEVDETDEVAETEEDITAEDTLAEVIDPLLDTSVSGTFYIVYQDQNLYSESNQASEVADIYLIDTEIQVSGIYGDTGLFQVVDGEENILGYVNSEFTDTVKGGLQDAELVEEVEETETSTTVSIENSSDSDKTSDSNNTTTETTPSTSESSSSASSGSSSTPVFDINNVDLSGFGTMDDFNVVHGDGVSMSDGSGLTHTNIQFN